MVVAWVVASAALFGLLVGALSIARTPRLDPIDPAAEERWLVSKLRRRPRVAHFVRARLDRTTAGGLMVTLAFSVTFTTALLVGLVLDMVNSNEGLAEFDESVSEWGSRNAGSGTVDVLRLVTNLGSTLWLAVALAAAAVFDFRRHRRKDALLFLLLVVAGEIVLTNGLKLIVDRDRPAVLRLTGASGPSFPSGHAAAAAACWAAIALVVTRTSARRVRAAAAAGAAFVAGAVAASRALLGVHWLTDIVAGLVLGWGWFTLLALAFGGRLLRLGEPLERVSPARGKFTATGRGRRAATS
jgi:membrane-associated phospholipid phosphatase